MTSRDLWTREQLIIAFCLYCQIPFNKTVKSNPEIIRAAKIIGRSPSALARKLGNFGSFDVTLKQRGISGLVNSSKLDKQIWDEFHQDWENLVGQSEKLIKVFSDQQYFDKVDDTSPNFFADDKAIITKVRGKQEFFRNSVMANYGYQCCVTGLTIPELLIASHIIPWAKDKMNRLNPQNGICLNSLHDKAFDRGLITISTDFKIILSSRIKEYDDNKMIQKMFYEYTGKKINLPEKFMPKAEFLQYHNLHIFLG